MSGSDTTGFVDHLALHAAAVESLAVGVQQRDHAVVALAVRLSSVMLGEIVANTRPGGPHVHEWDRMAPEGKELHTRYVLQPPANGPGMPPALHRIDDYEYWRTPGLMTIRFREVGQAVVDLTTPPNPSEVDATSRWTAAVEGFRTEWPQLLDGLESRYVSDIRRFWEAAGRNPMNNDAEAPVRVGDELLQPPDRSALLAERPLTLDLMRADLDSRAERIAGLQALRRSAAESVIEASSDLAAFLRREYPGLVSEIGLTSGEGPAVYRRRGPVPGRLGRVPGPFGRVHTTLVRLELPADSALLDVDHCADWPPPAALRRERWRRAGIGAAVSTDALRPVERAPQRDPAGRFLEGGWRVDPHDAAELLEVAAPRVGRQARRAQVEQRAVTAANTDGTIPATVVRRGPGGPRGPGGTVS